MEPSTDGNTLRSEKDNKTYALLASNAVILRPGEKMALKGKMTKDSSGAQSFQAQKVVKDYGPCGNATAKK